MTASSLSKSIMMIKVKGTQLIDAWWFEDHVNLAICLLAINLLYPYTLGHNIQNNILCIKKEDDN